MRRSELAEYIKETIIEVLSEATIETSPEDLSKVKQSAGKDDVIKVTEDDDTEPTAKDIKKNDSVSVISRKLQDTTKEMKSVVNQWKKAEGSEKDRFLDRLKELTKIKKELEGLL
tara:strand:- start:66 stop:410 length:345 start_codon:yes stop_codon:yes gene_type:complete